MAVVDASVLAAMFLDEPRAGDAARLLTGGDRLVAPDLVAIEVGSALARQVRRGLFAATDAVAAFRSLPSAGIRLVPHAALLADAFALSLRLRHALADCVYLALAQAEQAGLATFDRRLAAVAGELGIPLWTPEVA